MTAAAPATTTTAEPAVGRAGFDGLIRSEWTKVRSVRSTFWSLVLMAVLFVGLTGLLVSLTVAAWDDTAEADRLAIAADPTSVILASGYLVAQLPVCVLGVLVITSEYATGMIRSSMLAVPRRLPVLAAKALVLGVVVLLVSIVVAFVAFVVGAAVFESRAPVSLGDPGVVRAVVGSALYLSVVSLFAFAVGAIVRHTAGAITTVVVFVFMLAPLVQLIPGRVGEVLYALMPTEAGALISQAEQGPDNLLSPWQGFGVLCLWTAILLAVAAVLLKRRDT